MKTFKYILFAFFTIILNGCLLFPDDTLVDENNKFEDQTGASIYNYLVDNKQQYSKFIAIVDKGGMTTALSAYNPYQSGYTLFLPSDSAINAYIGSGSRFASFEALLADTEFTRAFCRYHVVNTLLLSSNFPFGSLSQPTLSDDYLTMGFFTDTQRSYFMVNNQARVIEKDIETSNGVIHRIESVLNPVVYSTYKWLVNNPDYSIFKQAVDTTGIRSLLDFNLKDDETLTAVTLLLAADSTFKQRGINNLSDLIAYLKPIDANYKNPLNALYSFVGYHILEGNYFVNNFVNVNSAYITKSEVPLNINGNGLDVLINPGKQIFDTIVVKKDTIVVNYIKFYYDYSNVLTNSGTVHFIDQVMTQKAPTRTNQEFQFNEEPYLVTARKTVGQYLLEEKLMKFVTWSGGNLWYNTRPDVSANQNIYGKQNDNLQIYGDFKVAYQVPKIIQGVYDVYIRAHRNSTSNAVVEVYVDGKKLGSPLDLTTGGTASSPFQRIKVGTVNFIRFSEHTVEIQTLIPGSFIWDSVEFVAI